MVTRHQLGKLSSRIDALAARFAPPEPPPELWLVDGARAWPQGASEAEAIPYEELKARPTGRTAFPDRIEVRLVHAENGGPAACCRPGGACFALHGPHGAPR